ncbi:MAG TPA: ATP-dependent DNA helicase [Solirubrobacteraceae bacterium]|nr:ATP-dependent DNA helicase [Solirubrobacteraceae bacterium]
MTEDGLTGPVREAVAHPGPALLIRGVAGSGKTSVIRERYLRFVAAGAPPERIALLVPSAARAAALREQLALRIAGGYEELLVLTPPELAARLLHGAGARGPGGPGWPGPTVGSGDRLALLNDRIDELSLRHHDVAGRPMALLGSFIRRIDRLKAERIDVERYRNWAASLAPDANPEAEIEREFAAVYAGHERLLAQLGARDEGGLLLDALAVAERRAGASPPAFDHVLIDDAHELDRAAASLALALGAPSLTVAGDPDAAVHRFRGAGRERLDGFAARPGVQAVQLASSLRCPPPVWRAALAALGREPAGPAGRERRVSAPAPAESGGTGTVALWRCSSERAEAQAVAVEVERLIARDAVDPAQIAVIVPEVTREGQALAVALEERAIPHRVIGEAAFFRRAEIRDLLAWLRLLVDPTDAAAVVRALARAPVELRSVDIARCTQIARRRKLDMVGAMAAALESPQVPPEARDRIRTFLSLYRTSLATIDSARPDLYVHRLIERLGLRRHQLFAAQADVAERLRALAAFGELATVHLARSPLATPREFARSVTALAEVGLGPQEEPDLRGERGAGELAGAARAVQVLAAAQAGGLAADHVFLVGLHNRIAGRAPEPIPDALLDEPLPPDDEATRARLLRQEIHLACSRTRVRLVLAYPCTDDRGEVLQPSAILEEIRAALGVQWSDREEELFGPAEALHSTYRVLRDELLEGTMRAAGRIGEMRLDTDLDVSHAVVRYLELLKVAALIAQNERRQAPPGSGDVPALAESLRDINARIMAAVSGEQREIYETSTLDEYLLDAERGARARAQAVAARDEPSLEAFLPLRGEGVVLSASDIDTYRTCPLKYKFARVFRIPQEPTLHQRFGILVHQVLERFHSPAGEELGGGRRATPGLPELLGLLDAGWRRGGFGDSLQERQLRGKAAAALTRYHERFQTEAGQPVWFERQFTFPIGPHLLRGRVDRVDRLPGGGYELIDYKTGRPKTAAQLADDVQLSLYAVGAREAWRLDASQQAYYYLLDDEKVAVPDDGDRAGWVREVATEVAEGIRAQGFEPTPSFAACSQCDYRLVCPAAER